MINHDGAINVYQTCWGKFNFSYFAKEAALLNKKKLTVII
jgi:hypothetical protein